MEEINPKGTRIIRVGTWGKQNGGPQNNWSFEVEEGHKLQSIKIDHDDSVIYSLMFTTECRGVMSTSKKFGGWNGGQTVLSQVTFDKDEELVGIQGSIGTKDSNTIISSLFFETNKTTHGPFGRTTDSVFSLPWVNGSLVGFYGLAGYYIDSIGFYVTPHEAITKIGTWGKTIPASPQNDWSFQLKRNFHLVKITIDHGDLIYSLMFTSQCGDITHTSEKFGGWNGGENVSEITFEWDEEIKAISGTVALSRGTYAGNTIISSISFETNKRTHGPFGNVRGAPFTVPWEHGSFAGFYGLCGYYIDSIGVYVKACEEIMKIGTWGKTIPAGPQNNWSFQLERNYHLLKIIIDHGDLIYSLMFTSQCGDMTRTSEKFGGWNGGENVSEITFEGNEEIKAISGTVALSRGNDAGNTIVSSISFVTNKRTHEPFGNERGTSFLVPWEYGSFAGFYGLCGYYIDSIGVYVKAPGEIMKIGTWGKSIPAGPQNNWSFQFERNYHLMKIKIDHGDLIYSLMFTSQCGDITHTSEKFGGWNGGEIVSEITFEGNEEIKAISGTVALSRGTDAGNTIISSISFLTNKRTHGPFGNVRGTPFTVPWEYGSLAGFYGLCGYYIDSIGVYLRATKR